MWTGVKNIGPASVGRNIKNMWTTSVLHCQIQVGRNIKIEWLEGHIKLVCFVERSSLT